MNDLKSAPPCSTRNAGPNVAPTQLPVLPVVTLPLPPLPATRAEMDARGWDAVDVVLVSGDAYVDHPGVRDGNPGPGPGGGGVPRGDPEPARLEERRSLANVRPAAPVLRHQCREHGQHDQPLHGQQEGPQRRRLQPGRSDRPEARPRDPALLPARPRGVPRRARDRRGGRGEPPAARPLRLLERHRQAVDPARLEGRPRRLRHGRAADRRDRPTVEGWRDRPRPPRHARRRLRPGCQGNAADGRDHPAELRGDQDRPLRVRQGDPDHPPGDEPAQREGPRPVSRPPGRRRQSPLAADQRGGHGPGLRSALHPPAPPDVQG